MKNKPNHEHNWIPLLGRVGGKNIPTSLFTCLKCGELKVGKHTIRISRDRLDMGNLPIKSMKTGTFYAEYPNGNSDSESPKPINWNNGQKQKVTLNNNCTFTFTAPAGSCNLILRCIGDGTVRTITWPGTVKWAAGTAPTMTGALDKWDAIAFYYDGTNYSAVISQNFGA